MKLWFRKRRREWRKVLLQLELNIKYIIFIDWNVLTFSLIYSQIRRLLSCLIFKKVSPPSDLVGSISRFSLNKELSNFNTCFWSRLCCNWKENKNPVFPVMFHGGQKLILHSCGGWILKVLISFLPSNQLNCRRRFDNSGLCYASSE